MSKIQKNEILKNRAPESKPDTSSPQKEFPQNLKAKIYDYIGPLSQASHYLQDNKFILHGYRVNFDSPKKIFKRFFSLKNLKLFSFLFCFT